MRQPAHGSSAYASPLDLILGAPLRVRVLRALDEAGDVRRASDLSRLSHANVSAVQGALRPLLASSLVEQIGSGRGAVYRIRAAHPLTPALRLLFGVERDRRHAIPRAIREWTDRATPAPLAVWLYGSVARGDDHFASDVDVALIAPGAAILSSSMRAPDADVAREAADALAQSLRDTLVPVAEAHALSPSVIVLLPHELLELAQRQPTLWHALLDESDALAGPTAAALVRRLAREAAPVSSGRTS